MHVLGLSTYLPTAVVDNNYFSAITGRSASQFHQLTGIKQRHRAAGCENSNTLSIGAVGKLPSALADNLAMVDYVIGCSYTPWDTVATMAHAVQRQFQLVRARAVQLSAACCSFLAALELLQALFTSGQSEVALIVTAEHNSLYARDEDPSSGHLWGDDAAAILCARKSHVGARLRLLDVYTIGLAHIGRGPQGVYLALKGEGLVMPHGKDIFLNATREMERAARTVLDRNHTTSKEIRMFVPHQANRRIMDCVAGRLRIPESSVASTVENLGNTGCASIPITLNSVVDQLNPDDLVLLAAFGGGYSAGAALLRAE